MFGLLPYALLMTEIPAVRHLAGGEKAANFQPQATIPEDIEGRAYSPAQFVAVELVTIGVKVMLMMSP